MHYKCILSFKNMTRPQWETFGRFSMVFRYIHGYTLHLYWLHTWVSSWPMISIWTRSWAMLRSLGRWTSSRCLQTNTYHLVQYSPLSSLSLPSFSLIVLCLLYNWRSVT